MRSIVALTMITLLWMLSSSPATCEVDDEVGTTVTVSMDGSLDALQEYFNQHQGRLRFVTLLSPT